MSVMLGIGSKFASIFSHEDGTVAKSSRVTSPRKAASNPPSVQRIKAANVVELTADHPAIIRQETQLLMLSFIPRQPSPARALGYDRNYPGARS